MASGKGPTTDVPQSALAGDNATATDTQVEPATPATADPNVVHLLPLARKNGAGDGGEVILGDEGAKADLLCRVYNLFGGDDGDVQVSVAVQTRQDATEEWREVAAWDAIDKAEDLTKEGVSLKRVTRAVYAVTGTDGGHAADVEVVATLKKSSKKA